MELALNHLRTNEKLSDYSEHMYGPNQYSEALGLPEIQAWESEFTTR
jgi:hypothetical protein